MKKYKVTVDGKSFTVSVEELTATDKTSIQTDSAFAVPATDQSVPNLEPQSARQLPDKQSEPTADPAAVKVKSPMPGSIVNLAVKSGDAVKKGEVLLVLEAMKMENEITAPQAGTIGAVYVRAGDTVGSEDLLMEIL